MKSEGERKLKQGSVYIDCAWSDAADVTVFDLVSQEL